MNKGMLNKGYLPIQICAWYYSFGIAALALVVLPGATEPSMWTLKTSALIGLAYGVVMWPIAAFLLTFANANAGPIMVMAFSPVQIVVNMGFQFVFEDTVPKTAQALGAAVVIVGLALFIAATWMLRHRDLETHDALVEDADGLSISHAVGDNVK